MTRGPTIVNKQIKASRKIESYIQPYRALERDTTRHEIQIYIYISLQKQLNLTTEWLPLQVAAKIWL